MESYLTIIISALSGGIFTSIGFFTKYFLDKKSRYKEYDKRMIEDFTAITLQYRVIFDEYITKSAFYQAFSFGDINSIAIETLSSVHKIDNETRLLTCKSAAVTELINELGEQDITEFPSHIISEYFEKAGGLDGGQLDELHGKTVKKFDDFYEAFAIPVQEYIEESI